MVLNRTGNFDPVLGILAIFVKYKVVDYSTVFVLTPFFVVKEFVFLNFTFNLIDIIGFLLFIGAISKSA